MPRRPPLDPEGTYHVSSRGCYGRTLFDTVGEHECFLRMYARIARKYRWSTLAWALMKNHHHFVIRLSGGGLSEGMRELHSGYARWIHEIYGQTRQGHLFRHAFFARQVTTDAHLLATCCYVDLNPTVHRADATPEASDWSGYAATIGLAHPRLFHAPAALLRLLGPSPGAARAQYRALVEVEHGRRRQVPSPNEVPGRG